MGTRAKLAVIAWFMIAVQVAAAQSISSPHSSYGGHDYSYFSIKITPDEAARFSIVENSGALTHQDFVAAQQNGTPFMLINASISDTSCQPLGYFVMNGSERGPVNQKSGDGNFYLKPNGAFLVTANDIEVVESGDIASHVGIIYGVQSGPMLINNQTVNPAFNSGSANRHIRCGVGISVLGGEKYVNFVISNEEVSFFELASFFQEKLKCTTALCLESAGCDMFFPERDVQYNAGGNIVCRYIKYVIE